MALLFRIEDATPASSLAVSVGPERHRSQRTNRRRGHGNVSLSLARDLLVCDSGGRRASERTRRPGPRPRSARFCRPGWRLAVVLLVRRGAACPDAGKGIIGPVFPMAPSLMYRCATDENDASASASASASSRKEAVAVGGGVERISARSARASPAGPMGMGWEQGST